MTRPRILPILSRWTGSNVPEPQTHEQDAIPALVTALDALAVRRQLARRLVGKGIEIGPGHVPFPVPGQIKVSYVDRWEPTQNSELFPELGDSPGFPEPEIVADLDVDRLSAIGDGTQDFVIASHVLEHLANPLAMLVEIHRVLRNGGMFVLLLPDRHRTFDREREPTPLPHLVDEYRRDVRAVDDAHIIDFIVGYLRDQGDRRDYEVLVAERTPDEIVLHRRRSVHVHVWDRAEFEQVLTLAHDELGLCFDIVDTLETGDAGTYGNEFGWLLVRREARRTAAPIS